MEAKGGEEHVSEGPWGRVTERLEGGRHQVAIKVALEAVLLCGIFQSSCFGL
jgi:hypothetical protein